MGNRSRDPRSPAQREAERQSYADASGKSVEEIRALEDALREVPREYLIEQLYGPDHGAFYDEGEDLWIVPDPKHRPLSSISTMSPRPMFRPRVTIWT